MKKTQLFILTFILLSINTFAQSRWEHIYGNSDEDNFYQSIMEYYDNGFLVCSTTGEKLDAWLLKTDVNGEILWEKTIVWDNYEIGFHTLLQQDNGDIVLAGLSRDESNYYWPMITKLDKCGNKLWCRTFVDEDYWFGSILDAIILENNDILAIGNLESQIQINRVFLYYITSDGELLWKKPYATKYDYPLIGGVFSYRLYNFDNNYYLAGDCTYPDEDTLHFRTRPMVICVDSNFNERWMLPYRGNDSISGSKARAIVRLNDSLFMGVGDSYEFCSLLFFFNDKGEELGFNRILNEQINPEIIGNFIRDIAAINDTMFITITGFVKEQTEPFVLANMLIDTGGNVYDYKIQENSVARGKIIKTSDDKFANGVLYKLDDGSYKTKFYKINSNLEQDTIYPGTYVYDSLCPDSIESGIIDISDCLVIVNTDEIPGPEEYFSNKNKIVINAMPNPATGSIKLLLENKDDLSNLKIICSDTYGRKLYSQSLNTNQTDVAIDISTWPSGMYISYITSNGKVVGQCRFVVR